MSVLLYGTYNKSVRVVTYIPAGALLAEGVVGAKGDSVSERIGSADAAAVVVEGLGRNRPL